MEPRLLIVSAALEPRERGGDVLYKEPSDEELCADRGARAGQLALENGLTLADLDGDDGCWVCLSI